MVKVTQRLGKLLTQLAVLSTSGIQKYCQEYLTNNRTLKQSVDATPLEGDKNPRTGGGTLDLCDGRLVFHL